MIKTVYAKAYLRAFVFSSYQKWFVPLFVLDLTHTLISEHSHLCSVCCQKNIHTHVNTSIYMAVEKFATFVHILFCFVGSSVPIIFE